MDSDPVYLVKQPVNRSIIDESCQLSNELCANCPVDINNMAERSKTEISGVRTVSLLGKYFLSNFKHNHLRSDTSFKRFKS